MSELSKSYDPSGIEQSTYERWLKSGVFSSAPNRETTPYSILMPPPNVTGVLTMGHVINNTIQDIYIRRHRMQGEETCWFPGLDHAGIATQTKVEQKLREEKLTRHDLGREKFLEQVWDWKHQYGDIILQQMRSIGISCDWNRTLFTMDESASNAVRETFIRLFDEGLIYRGKRIINWSPVAQSALSDEEVLFREVKEHIYTLRYHFESRNGWLNVATVRPETIFGDVAVAVNPGDERYKHLIGTNVIVPITGKAIPIIGDDYADPTFGTGCVKITPAHDPNDFEVGIRHSLPMPNAINADATLNELAGEFKGLDRFVARKQVMSRLQELDLIEKVEDYTHNVGFSERGGEPVEPYLSDQWFVNMKPLAEPALKAVVDGDIKFYPNHWVKTYEHWMNGIRDWCISRQLWWGHRIPVYYAEDGTFTAASSEDKARTKLGLSADAKLRQDPDVLDTWFSSWLWPMTTMGWLADGKTEQTDDMSFYLPSNLLVTGPDIIFFWV
ncbi:MAG: valine--tRNA ligase, partial [Bacteroidota bacterium]